jgi:hypothetical protein
LAGSATRSAASAICRGVALDPRIGTMIHRTPASRTTRSCSTYLGSSRLMAVSVTTVLIPRIARISRSAPGRCQAPRTTFPGATTTSFFGATSSRSHPATTAPADARTSKAAARPRRNRSLPMALSNAAPPPPPAAPPIDGGL